VAGKIITFYSYKGGTGRSMALANVAFCLSSQPSENVSTESDAPPYKNRKVLMVDWDLEAPGLYRYFEKDFAERSRISLRRGFERPLQNAKGLVEFFELAEKIYRDRCPEGSLPESQAHTKEAAEIYAEVCRQIKFDDELLLQVGDNENLKLLKAGFEDELYPNRVRTFNWENFYERYGSFFVHFREHLTRDFDFVLIDSRTGLTDTGGICTRVMPEKLVAVFAPNVQNIEGVKKSCAKGHRAPA
jgi:cellulose biosynthesis protein BcsQ